MSFEPTLTNYVTFDLLSWQEQGVLTLSPKFQRRSVWKPVAKSYFIDTLLRGFPAPPIHIRLTTDFKRGAVREVVDGQQRLRSVFDFIAGKFRIGRQIQGDWSNKTYTQLSDQQRNQLLGYKFQIYQYQDIDDRTVLEIFARINTYSVALNAQELRNGRYFGYFKTTVYSLGLDYLQLWKSMGLFSDSSIARMNEAELVSELLVAQLDGLQDKKASLDDFYSHLEDEWADEPVSWIWRKSEKPTQWLSRQRCEDRFRKTMDSIQDAVGEILPLSEFSRVPLFYSLYNAVYHRLYGLPGFARPTPAHALDLDSRLRLREVVEQLSELVADKTPPDDLRGWRRDFIIAAARQTDNIGPRRRRLEIIWDRAELGA
jgi:hypothetical protein